MDIFTNRRKKTLNDSNRKDEVNTDEAISVVTLTLVTVANLQRCNQKNNTFKREGVSKTKKTSFTLWSSSVTKYNTAELKPEW